THELRDQTELEEVLGLDLGEHVAQLTIRLAAYLPPEAHAGLPDPAFDDLVEADERPPADEQDVRGVDLDELLVRMLAAALGWDVRDRALEDLEQGLLDALTGNVSGDRGILGLPRDLVDFVNVDD